MWDILLATEVAAKALAGGGDPHKSVKHQTEYLGTKKTKVPLHEVPLYISGDHLGFFFAKFRGSPIYHLSKAGIATGDVEIWVTVTRKNFMEIPNMLICGGRPIYVIVEGPRLFYWGCGAAGHLSKVFHGKRPEP